MATMTREGHPSYQAGAHDEGVHIHRTKARIKIGNTPIDPRYSHLIRQGIRQLEPDVIVAHCPVPFAAEAAYNEASRCGLPFITTYHAGRLRGSSFMLEAVARVLDATIERRMLAGSAGLIAVSPYVRDHALGEHGHRARVIPPGVDTNIFTPTSEHVLDEGLEPASAGPNILFVGPLARAYRWKGIDVLCQAFQTIQKTLPRATLTLVGKGDRSPEFHRLANTSGGSIQVHDWLSQTQLADAYRRADVVVLPSLTDAESFGMVLAEANACATPVVASNIGGIPDFVRDGDNGLLARPGDARDLAQKIQAVLKDPDEAHAMGKRGQRRVETDHNWDTLAIDTEHVLRRAARTLVHP